MVITNKRRKKGEGSMYFDKKRKYWRVSITLPTGKRKDFCSKCKIIAIANENKFINKYKEKIKATIENDKTSEGLLLKEINKNLMKFKIKYFKKINLSLQRKLYYKKNKEHIKKRNKVYKESNKDKLKEYNHNYYKKNKEIISAKKKEYYRKKLESQGKTYTKPTYSKEFKEKVLKSYINQEYGGVVITARKFGISKATLQDWIKKSNSDVKKKQRVERLKKRKKWDRTYYLKHKEQIKEYKKEYYLRKKGEKEQK